MLFRLVVCAVLFIAPVFNGAFLERGLAAPPGAELEFISLPPFKQVSNASYGPILIDIMSHEAPWDSNPYTDLVTLGHETSHGIHAHIRNELNTTGKQANGFYVLDNRAVIIVEPNFRISQLPPYIPSNLHGPRYDLYLNGSSGWDDTPLYLFDEWNSYVNGAEVGIDQVRLGLWTQGWRDAMMGPIEFVVYSTVVAMAARDLQPTYLETNLQFRAFLAWNIERTLRLFLEGRHYEEFKYEKQDEYYSQLLTSTEAAPIRRFLRELYGNAWFDQVFLP